MKKTKQESLLAPRNLVQTPYQTLLIILPMKFIKLNANMGMIMKNVKRVKLNTNIVGAVLNIPTLKMI